MSHPNCISCPLEFSSLSFGYVIEGAELLRDIKEGDIIVSAIVTSGLENLVSPQA
jgi:cyclophilin family peptidyl-prolyl cis-trans isomerase